MFSRLVCWCIYKNKNPRYLDYSEVCLAQLLHQFDRCDFRREIFYVCDAFTVQSSVGLWSYPASNVLKEKTVSIVHRNRDIAHPPKGLDGTKQQPYQPSVRNRFACFFVSLVFSKYHSLYVMMNLSPTCVSCAQKAGFSANLFMTHGMPGTWVFVKKISRKYLQWLFYFTRGTR